MHSQSNVIPIRDFVMTPQSTEGKRECVMRAVVKLLRHIDIITSQKRQLGDGFKITDKPIILEENLEVEERKFYP